jgi:tetratricopeptide (TPR) repeat protein
LRTDQAFGLHCFERRFAAAEAQLLSAIAEQPKLASAYAFLSMLYVSWNRFDEAERMLRLARSADALSANLALAEILVRFCSRRFEAAVDYGKQVLDLHPYFPTAMAFYAAALEKLGRWEQAAELYRRVCVLAPETGWYRALEGACLARSGRRAEAETALADIERMRQTHYVDGYHTSLLKRALGRADAMEELEDAYATGSPMVTLLPVDPKFDDFAGDARFEALRAKIVAENSPVAC